MGYRIIYYDSDANEYVDDTIYETYEEAEAIIGNETSNPIYINGIDVAGGTIEEV